MKLSEDKVLSKTLCRLTFQEVVKLQEITDGIHNPYNFAQWIPEKDVEGLVAELETLVLDENEYSKEQRVAVYHFIRTYLLPLLRAEEQKKETE